ncbi:unnamed protein product [Camellia sinensis]
MLIDETYSPRGAHDAGLGVSMPTGSHVLLN